MSAKIWGDYEVHLDKTLGKGGMGAVYRGRQISVDRPVAIKVLKRDLTSSPDFVGRFQREATLLAKLVDTHIVQIFGAGEAEGQHFYAMEFVEGEDLASRLRRGHQFSPDEILHITIGTGKALDAAWKQKIIHRDIKPSNIIVAESDQVVKVMDFGLAKNPENDLTQTEMIMGTAKYMSPEQATGGECDIRSDLYALGAVMYELGTGTAPFVGESATAVIYQHVHKDPVPPQKLNPSLPQSMQGVILRLLSKSPDDRYQEPIELVKDCQAILEGVTPDEKTILYGEIGKTPPSTVESAKTGDKTSLVSAQSGGGKGKWIGLLLAVFLLGGAGVWFGPQIISAIMGKGDKVELALTEAKEAASSGEWDRAVQKYTEALRYLPDGDKRRKEIEGLRDSAGYQSTMSMAEKSKGTGNLQEALEKYAEALKWLPDGDSRLGKVQRLILDTRIELVEKFTIQRKWNQVIQECDELHASLSEEDSRRSKVSSLRDRAKGERALVKADEGFEDQKWPVAIQEYAAAMQLLPEDHPRWKSLPGRISVSEYEVHIGAASRETDLDQRIILLEQASKVSGLEADRKDNAVKLLRRARVTRALDQASKLEIVKDWSGVGKALREAAQYEDSNTKVEEYRSKGGFYVEFGNLVHLMANRKWKEAEKMVQALLSTSAHYGNTDELSRREGVIKENLARLVEEEKTRLRTEFLLLVGDSIQEYEKGAWAVAKEKIVAAAQAAYKPYWELAKTEFKEP
ncbi:MAG: protein kinase, partial [Planctomycetota bacterium]|nr:protein kinase [Planctomycetota bacterium]